MNLLSLIVPVYNEANNLERLLPMLFEAPCQIEREWIFVDDGSSDGSGQLLQALQEQYEFKLLLHDRNRGKGAAVISGLQECSGNFILIQDADFELNPDDIPSLLEPVLADEADVVYGSRFKKNNPQIRRTYHYLGNRALTALSNLMSGIYLTDEATCYKLLRADLFKAMKLHTRRFGIDIEITAYLAKTTARIYEVPIRYYPRSHRGGKKITWRDGVAALIHLVRFNLLTDLNRAFTKLPERYHPEHVRIPPQSEDVA